MANPADAPTATQTVTLYLRVRGAADAIAFYEKAFGAVERPGRMTMPDGKIAHASLMIGNSEVMLSDEFPDWDSPEPQTLGGTKIEDLSPDELGRRAAAWIKENAG